MAGTATTGRAGIGVLFQVGSTDTVTTWTTIANVTELQAGGVTLATVDATQLDSPDFYSEFLPTLKTADDVTATLQWDPDNATHVSLRDILENRELRKFKMNTSQIDATISLICNAYVTQLGNITVQPTGIMTQQLQLKPSGKWTTVANS